MPPLRASVANTAFADAALLSRLLRTGHAVPEIVAEYERDVARPGAKAVEETARRRSRGTSAAPPRSRCAPWRYQRWICAGGLSATRLLRLGSRCRPVLP
jgi:2-polyprenyl-6-methoxyphenol hydroxylase-like FAD-dependent oxidoreductase